MMMNSLIANTRLLYVATMLTICTYITGIAPDAVAERTSRMPNIIFVLADDLGWRDLNCYGNTFHDTPHINRLAREGMRFTQAYAAAPVCSPYRAALLTGQYPARIGITDYLRPNSANALSETHTTLAEALQDAGYATGMIGKWHLTGYQFHGAEYEERPTQHGFEWNLGSEIKGVGNGANFWPYVFRKQPVRWLDIRENRLGEAEYLTDRLNTEAVDFIDRHKEQPFFLFLSHYAPHTILNGRPDLVEKYRSRHKPGPSTRSRCYLCEDKGYTGDPLHHWAGSHNPHLAAMIESIDDGVGHIIEKLNELQLADDTILIFSSDNGGETNVTSNAPLRGGKSQLYEGGIRVPLIVRWPGHIAPSTVCDQPTMNVDFYPTLLEAAGLHAPDDQMMDGISILPTLRNPAERIDREALYWHYPLDRPHFLGGASGGAIRAGDWKLIEFFDDHRTELYNLAEDPGELQNVAQQHPEHTARLLRQLTVWRAETGARTPSPPLLTEPKQLEFADHFASNRASRRWGFNADWIVSNDMLIRTDDGQESTRVFLKETRFKDALIRFDFQMRQSRDIRLVTGSNGHYNSVIHIRPDHFYVQTAKDASGPYFSYRHGECAFQFDPLQWYTMTVEFQGDRVVAHIDHDHIAMGQHPMINQDRTYFAFQADEHTAAFDNVQIFSVRPHPRQQKNMEYIASVADKHPVRRSLAEEFEIRRKNAHDWFYQRDAEYRALAKRVEDLDAELKRLFPEAFQSHKEFRKQIQEQRKQLIQNDPHYKELLHATHRANRAIEAWLFAQRPGSAELPDSQRKNTLRQLEKQFRDHPDYRALVAAARQAQQTLENAYPQLFVTDEQINQKRQTSRQAIKNDARFQTLNKQRAEAWRALQNYPLNHDPVLARLYRQLHEAEQ